MLSDAGRQVLYASSALSDLTGVPLEEIANRGRDEWIAKFARRLADPSGAWRRLQAEAGGPFVAREDLELVLPERRWVRWTSKPVVIGGRWAQLCTFADVTAERELEARREALALTDELTLLPNRRAAEEALAREAARAGRWAIPVGLARFEVGDLEEIGQTHGPARAEALLSFLANLLGNTVRAGDLLCRWDAGRFLAVLTGIDLEGARAVVERAQAAVRTKVDPALPPATLSVAVGQLVAEEQPWVAVERLACELDQAARARAVQAG
jgi:diguanylate cyclase (GGDEF)-like protein